LDKISKVIDKYIVVKAEKKKDKTLNGPIEILQGIAKAAPVYHLQTKIYQVMST
jgi:hypothetical protein